MVMSNPPEGHPAFDPSGRPGDRFENVGPGVDEWYASTDQGTSTWDLCEVCAPAHRKTPHQYENIQAYGFGSPNRDASQGTIYEPTGGPGIGGGVKGAETSSAQRPTGGSPQVLRKMEVELHKRERGNFSLPGKKRAKISSDQGLKS